MLERIDKINKNKTDEIIKNNENSSSKFEIMKIALEKEKYTRATNQGIIDKMLEGKVKINKEIMSIQVENKKVLQKIEIEKKNEMSINYIANKLYSNARKQENVTYLL